jgi:hypothetical protein
MPNRASCRTRRKPVHWPARRGVQGRYTQRLYQLVHHTRAPCLAQLRHRQLRRTHKTAPLPPRSLATNEKRSAQLQPRAVAIATMASSGPASWRPMAGVCRPVPSANGSASGRRSSGFRVHTHQAHYTQRVHVGANQDVLAVVQRNGRAVRQVGRHGACPTTQRAGCFKNGDGMPAWQAATAAAMPAQPPPTMPTRMPRKPVCQVVLPPGRPKAKRAPLGGSAVHAVTSVGVTSSLTLAPSTPATSCAAG